MNEAMQGYFDDMLSDAVPEVAAVPHSEKPPENAVVAPVITQPAAPSAPQERPQQHAVVAFPNADAVYAAAATTAREQVEWVCFELAEQCYALNVRGVREIVRMPRLDSVPHAPAALCGVANLRGAVVAVFDMRTLLGLPEKELSNAARVIIIDHDGDVIGLLVERVFEIVRIDAEEAETPPPTGADVPHVTHLLRQAERLVQCVSVASLFSSE